MNIVRMPGSIVKASESKFLVQVLAMAFLPQKGEKKSITSKAMNSN